MAPPTDDRASSGFDGADRAHMRAALGLARRGLGTVWPNPAVGCVLVRPDLGPAGRVVGRGWTQPGGRPHAETEAIRRAGDLARGAHAYVTLEPCNHHGHTGPCSEALIAAGVGAVTAAIADPDPRTAGTGLERLRAAGVRVRNGLLAADARALNAGFLHVQTRNRPWVTLKTATTLDGMIAARTGASQWITGAAARRRGHLLRARNDAVITGIGTVRADDPELTCRLPGLGHRSPVRVVIDAKGELGPDTKLRTTAQRAPLWLVTGDDADPSNPAVARLSGDDIRVFRMPADGNGRLDPLTILQKLAEAGITRVLVEAGAALSAAFLAADLVDEIAWFRAPAVIGGDGLAAFAPLGVAAPGAAPRFRRVETFALDDDVLERYVRRDSEE